jgi:hypothetical protein
MSKTVFILGAGFSADACIPVQEEILRNLSVELKRARGQVSSWLR